VGTNEYPACMGTKAASFLSPGRAMADKDALEAFLDALTDDEFLADPRFSDPFQR